MHTWYTHDTFWRELELSGKLPSTYKKRSESSISDPLLVNVGCPLYQSIEIWLDPPINLVDSSLRFHLRRGVDEICFLQDTKPRSQILRVTMIFGNAESWPSSCLGILVTAKLLGLSARFSRTEDLLEFIILLSISHTNCWGLRLQRWKNNSWDWQHK